MKSRSLILSVCISALVATGAFAQASRTWVSGVGDDVNPCSRTAPCKTFAGAISKTAPGGQISVLDPGGFGAVTITKAITIEGGHELGSLINSFTNGIIINAGVNDNVILRNLQIDGVGSGLAGVTIFSAKNVTIDHTAIFNQGDGQNGRGINIVPTAATVRVDLHDLDIYNCGVNGIRSAPTGAGFVFLNADDVRIDHIGTANTHDGFDIEASTGAQLKDVRVFHAAGSGLKINGGLANVDDSFFSRNGADGIQLNNAGAFLRISNSTMTQNGNAGVRATVGSISSYKNNRSSDNGLPDTVPTTLTLY
jgi:nitrous oxidase accessory protein NosD